MTDGEGGPGGADGIDERHPLESIFHRAVEKASEDGDLTVNEVMEVFGARSLGPILIVLGLIATVPPIGAIPLVPTTTGVLTLLFSVQFAVGRRRVWVPRVIGERAVSEDRLRAGERRAGKVAARIDRAVKRRLAFLTEGAMPRLWALAACVLAVMMPPLELVPFGVAVPGAALICLGIGIVSRDGAFLIAGASVGAATVALIAFAVPWGVIAGWLR